jgi:tetratricopeptide (TPR) repeat protein
VRAKLPKAEGTRTDASLLPFSGFLDLLKRRGFAVGVDRHLRLVSLLEKIGGECRPEQLKHLTAPLFATNEKDQARFYRVFDEYFVLLRPNVPREETEGQPDAQIIEGKSKSRPRHVLIWGSLTLFLAVILIFWVRFPYAPPSQPKKPNSAPKPSETVLPRSMPNAGPMAGNPSVIASLTPPPLVQPEPAENAVMPVLARNRTALFWIGGILPLALFAADELRRFYKRRQLVLERTRGRKPPFMWPIQIEPRPLGYLRSEQFYKVARKLRRRQVAEYRRLDIARTIDATIAASGYPIFQYRPDSRIPEYLVLIDRASSRDHQTALFDRLAQALQREGIFVTRYFFDGDPRVCWSERATASVSLTDLQKIFSEHRLIIFGRGDRLIDPVTGALTEWSAMFLEWRDRAVVTPAAPSGWNQREQTLMEQFLVFPASLEGIEQLAERFDSSVPTELEVSDADDPLPPDVERNSNLGKLQSYLGEPVFQWLCACATYPELYWDLTLLLGSLPALGEHLVTERNLLRLVRIAWFRAGAIPDEQRLQLLAALDPAKEVAVRAAIVRTLEKSTAPEASFAAENRRLEIVLQECLLERRSMSELKSALRSLPMDEVTRDYVLLHETRRISRLAFALPVQVRSLFFEKGISALGLNFGARLGVTSAVIVATLLAVAFLLPKDNRFSDPAVAHMNRGVELAQQKYFDAATEEFGKAIKKNPNDARAYANRGTAYRQGARAALADGDQEGASTKYQSAMADFSKGIELSPKDASLYQERGGAEIELKQYDAALADLNKALELKPDDLNTIKFRGFAELGLSQWDKAVADFTAVIQKNPDDLQNYDRRALAYRGLKNYDAAIADYTFLLGKNPNDVEALVKRGYTYSLAQQYEKAIPDYEAALKINPQDNDTFQRLQYAQSMLAAKNATPSPTPPMRAERLKKNG